MIPISHEACFPLFSIYIFRGPHSGVYICNNLTRRLLLARTTNHPAALQEPPTAPIQDQVNHPDREEILGQEAAPDREEQHGQPKQREPETRRASQRPHGIIAEETSPEAVNLVAAGPQETEKDLPEETTGQMEANGKRTSRRKNLKKTTSSLKALSARFWPEPCSR